MHVERRRLNVTMMYRDFGSHVRIAFDPRKISEDAALALLCTRLPHLVGSETFNLHTA